MSAKNEQELAEKLSNFEGDRYDVVVLASMWAKELKKTEPYKEMPTASVIKDALDDIVSGRVSREKVLEVCKVNLEKELQAAEAARLEAERKAKEPMRL